MSRDGGGERAQSGLYWRRPAPVTVGSAHSCPTPALSAGAEASVTRSFHELVEGVGTRAECLPLGRAQESGGVSPLSGRDDPGGWPG